MQKAGGILAIVGATISFLPILGGMAFGGLVVGLEEIDKAVEESELDVGQIIEGVDEEGNDLTSEEITEAGQQLVIMSFGSLICCALTLGFGIVALITKRPLIWGLVIIVSAGLGLVLGRLFAIVLVLSIIGGILTCFAKPKDKDVSKIPTT